MLRFFRIPLFLLCVLLLFLANFIIWAKFPNTYPQAGFVEYGINYEPVPPDYYNRIRLLTYNIGFASGKKNNLGSVLTKDEVLKNLDGIANAIKNINPDVVALQEVDFDSYRTFGINQMEYVALKAGYKYAYYAVTWNKHYVTWPYWPTNLHFKRVVSGQVLLSKFRFDKKTAIETTFPKPKKNPFWYNWFYLDRVVQKVTLPYGDKKIDLWNVHLEAFDEEARREQTGELADRVSAAYKSDLSFVLGDFNSPSAFDKSIVGLEREVFVRSERNITQFSAITGLMSAGSGYTFPSWAPTHKIDHIFYKSNDKPVRSGTVDGVTASDHLAVWMEYNL